MRRVRLGIMGFGLIGRQLYQHALEGDAFEVAAISDVGSPEILHYLLTRDLREPECRLEHNHLVNDTFSTRMLRADRPQEIPWDAFGVDAVIDATARFRSRVDMQAHIDNGAPRVLISTVPLDDIDRFVIPGINMNEITRADRMISAGSASTTAMALVLRALGDRFPIELATMTSIHAYTSDQSLQDYAGADYRRSRSGAENIIPNTSEAPRWVERVLPAFAGKLSGYALNVPVQKGSLLDLTIVFRSADVTVEQVNAAMADAAEREPELIGVARDPIVSSDVIGCGQSVLFDLHATMKAGKHMMKTLSWHESRGHANRILDVVERYSVLDAGALETERTS